MKTPNAVFITNNREAFERNFQEGQLFTTLDLLQGAIEYYPELNSFLVVVFDPTIQKDYKLYEEKLNLCQCEHVEHFRTDTQTHMYLDALAGSQRAMYVGLICDECAHGHLKDYIVS